MNQLSSQDFFLEIPHFKEHLMLGEVTSMYLV